MGKGARESYCHSCRLVRAKDYCKMPGVGTDWSNTIAQWNLKSHVLQKLTEEGTEIPQFFSGERSPV